ncbi:MAG TPA: serine/threonine-protein kinase [Myxococcaceae bacterium]|jgi:tetratricopeptide (TPR) repeat protein/predicted Ser/Thr protein kinase
MCPSEDEIAGVVEGRLPQEQVERIHRHAAGCSPCRLLLALMAQDATPPTDVSGTSPFADRADDARAAVAAPEVAPLACIGRYRVLEHLGSGGMGTVLAAYDPELDRRIALKVLRARPGDARGREDLQRRLQREAQAMAKLAHPNVVAVHDVGTYAGRVFVAMEYVDGSNLRQWLKAAPRGWTEIRDVFVQAARGLQAAHEVGLVHRDFKPDNVLIGKDGRVRVADFGLARAGASGPPEPADATDPEPPGASLSPLSAPLTRAGVVMGTPRYMAPEQMEGGASDARADEFAFAVALFEALFMKPPFASDDIDGRLRSIRQGPPEPPASAPPVPDWLQQVLRRALRFEPEERFPSMRELTDALQVDLRRRGVSARLAASVAAAALLLAGAVAFGLERSLLRCRGSEQRLAGVWDGARRAQVGQAFLKAAPAELGPEGARAQLERTSAALDAYARDWAAMHHEACAAARISGEQTEAVLSLRMACLDRRMRELGQLTALLAAADAPLVDKGVEAALGLSSLRTCADVASLTGRAPPPESPAARAEVDRLELELSEANAVRLAGRFAPALERAGSALEAARALGYRPLQAEALYLSGVLQEKLGRTGEAERSLVEATYAADAGRDDATKARAASRLVYLSSLRSTFDRGHHWKEVASAALERAGPDPELEGELLNNAGSLALAEGRPDGALAAYERAAKLLEAALGREHPKTLNAITNLASADVALGRPGDAVRSLEAAIPAIERLRGAGHPALISSLWTLAQAQVQLHRLDEAAEAADRALRIARERLGLRHARVAGSLQLQATVLQAGGQFQRALETYREAQAILAGAVPPSDPELFFCEDGIGESLLGLGRAKEAVPHLEAALKLRLSPFPERADAQLALSRALWASGGDRRRAQSLAREARDAHAAARREEKAREANDWLEAHFAVGSDAVR